MDKNKFKKIFNEAAQDFENYIRKLNDEFAKENDGSNISAVIFNTHQIVTFIPYFKLVRQYIDELKEKDFDKYICTLIIIDLYSVCYERSNDPDQKLGLYFVKLLSKREYHYRDINLDDPYFLNTIYNGFDIYKNMIESEDDHTLKLQIAVLDDDSRSRNTYLLTSVDEIPVKAKLKDITEVK